MSTGHHVSLVHMFGCNVSLFVALLQGLGGVGVGDEEEVLKLAASTPHKRMSLLDKWQACSSTAQVS